ncbi:DUF2845 domain-containing protein [Jeongeupia naejangsanensis]|uniref:DUF2845 domain-containing protein n=1 Tax=Jeongeupia naejangsanensis TaxID=613195 RepID=A0ABS2BGR3_9NEIS|nr:DUF2845 domain-containing protein [Jeongeupia naejangsanensis]MBM3114810.1 DUF2845 domain-containing protein [Jeongeupia naejangsanensis]
MKQMKLAALIVATASTLCALPAFADSFRCQNNLVSLGDSRAEVLQKCGEPFVRDSFCESRQATTAPLPNGGTVVNVNQCESVDEWTYNPGSGKFLTTLRFESGRLSGIKLGDRAK